MKLMHDLHQTSLLLWDINLLGCVPRFADDIMQNEILTQYDRLYIGKLCKCAEMRKCAAKHNTEINDIKHIFINSHQIDPDFVVTFFEKLNRK